MSLPPLANLFAVHDPDPQVLAAIENQLREGSAFDQIWRPVAGWIAASKTLSGGAPADQGASIAGLSFAEGRDVVTAGANDPRQRFREIAELSDTEPERLGSFSGDFGLIHFRPDGSVLVVRSCGGLVPFYFSHSGERIAVGTTLTALVRYRPEKASIDPLVLAMWASLASVFPAGRTFLAGVSILERGAFVELGRGKVVRTGRYWDPRRAEPPRPNRRLAEEHAERLRAILLAKLQRDLDPGGVNLLTLSGGVDSSSLGALAAAEPSRRIWTWSLLPARQDLLEKELSYIDDLDRRCRFEKRLSVQATASTWLALLQVAPRVVFPIQHPALCALPGILREGPVSVLFGGEFADEVCGSIFRFPDWVSSSSLWSVLAGLRELPFGWRDIPRWIKRRWFPRRTPDDFSPYYPHDLSAFVRSELREEYRAWREELVVEAFSEPGFCRCLVTASRYDGFIAMNWEAAASLGIRRSFPFFHREVLELAFECHPWELLGPGTKKLLRQALKNDVPRRQLERPDKGSWGTYGTEIRDSPVAWQADFSPELASVLDARVAPRRGDSVTHWDAFGLLQVVKFGENMLGQARIGALA